MGDKFLSEVIDYARDMKKHNFIAIYSGVGSGKNRFIDSFYKVDEEIPNPQMTVLVITSRRAKVDEILDANELDIKGSIGRWGNVHRKKTDDETEEEFREKSKNHLRVIEDGNQRHFVYQKSVVCTNAFIEKYLQYVYEPSDVTTHLWELFDMIVVDEAHSLILDASYQSAPFYVNDLIKEYLWRCELAESDYHLYPQCKHLVLMTGTPEHLKELSVVWKNHLHIIDKREECINVFPQNIYFIKKNEIVKRLKKNLKKSERTICFSQSITTLKNYYDKLDVPDKSTIAFSFSKEEERTSLPEEEKKIMERTEESIRQNQKLPGDIQLFLSTERNKEGINIKDEDIVNLYVDSKHMGDIVQMAGRVRAGVKNMFVVVDGGFKAKEVLLSHDAILSFRKLVGNNERTRVLIDYWKEVCERNGGYLFNNRSTITTAYKEKWSADFVDFVHEKFPFIRYSYFRNNFEFYENAYNGQWDYSSALDTWEMRLDSGEITKQFKNWFPNATVHGFGGKMQIEEAKQYIEDNLVLGELYSYNDREKIIADLNSILGTTYEQIHHIFKLMKVEYKMMPVTSSGKERKKKILEHEMDKKIILFIEK